MLMANYFPDLEGDTAKGTSGSKNNIIPRFFQISTARKQDLLTPLEFFKSLGTDRRLTNSQHRQGVFIQISKTIFSMRGIDATAFGLHLPSLP
jgi:hypothetical protein